MQISVTLMHVYSLQGEFHMKRVIIKLEGQVLLKFKHLLTTSYLTERILLY